MDAEANVVVVATHATSTLLTAGPSVVQKVRSENP